MNQPSREQVRLILDDSVIRAKKAVDTRIKAIYAKYNAKGLLKSGATIKGVVGAVEEIGSEFIKHCVDDVAPVAKDFEAFAMITEAVEAFLRYVAAKVDSTAEFASGSEQRSMDAAKKLFLESESSMRRQLEIHRFTFTVPQGIAIPQATPSRPSSTPPVVKNKGGKPLSAHWDEMWSSIAVMLYVGDLQPASQADIERAMKDWFAANEFDVGDTTVRDRARKLWQKLKSAE